MQSIEVGIFRLSTHMRVVGVPLPSSTIQVTVLRASDDRTNGGVSGRHDYLFVVLPGQAPPEDTAAQVMVLDGCGDRAYLRPLEGPGRFRGQVGPMPGGNYAVGGPEFAAAVSGVVGRPFNGAVPIHDRYESQELHDQLDGLLGNLQRR